MSFTINTNIMSINAQRNLRRTEGPLQETMQRLSSGLRVNSAKDDAAGLAIATRMTSQIRGLTVAVRNASDGLSIAQTAEGAMDEVVNDLQRIRELAVQAKSGQYTASDIQYMQIEVNTLVEEIERIADQSKFNGVNLFNGYFDMSLQVSFAATDSTIGINMGTFYNVATTAGFTSAAAAATAGWEGYGGTTAYGGYVYSGFSSTGTPNTTAWTSTLTLSLDNLILWATDTSTYSTAYGALLQDNPNYVSGTTPTDRRFISNASNTMAIVDSVMNYVVSQRSLLGAKANQFEAAIRNLENVIETTTSARSRILDADFAAETANMTKYLILQQAGISVLSQANTVPQNVLALIR
ncbi:Flagellin [Candidatus Magnetoovum chiemensis]|nr:Flagellin [Candidatus Magnetoovum chiemensis]